MTKFYKWGDRNPKPQYYDKEKIEITKGGKTYNVYDSIQAANVDTDIYEVMKKYHCMEEEAVQIMNEKGGEKGIFEDITELQKQIQDIGDVKRIAQQAQEMFDNLPVEIRQAAGNNLEYWYEEQKKKYKKEQQPNSTNETNTKEGDQVNETK